MPPKRTRNSIMLYFGLVVLVLAVVGCGSSASSVTPVAHTGTLDEVPPQEKRETEASYKAALAEAAKPKGLIADACTATTNHKLIARCKLGLEELETAYNNEEASMGEIEKDLESVDAAALNYLPRFAGERGTESDVHLAIGVAIQHLDLHAEGKELETPTEASG